MDCYVIREQVGQECTAATKAPADVEYFLRKRGYQTLTVQAHDPENTSFWGRLMHRRGCLEDWLDIYRAVEEDSLLIVQYPLMLDAPFQDKVLQQLRTKKQVKVVYLIHNLNSLRGLTDQTDEDEIQYLDEMADGIICHNDKMRQYLSDNGIASHKLFTLELFDYAAPKLTEEHKPARGSVMIAGNLSPEQCAYVYKLHEIEGVNFDLFGANYQNTDEHENVIYRGVVSPDKLPRTLVGMFGLVWDGASLDSCTGSTGNYLKHNTPHKLSLYLAAGVPVVVWDQSAIADLVTRYGVGICVSSLHELSEKIGALQGADYRKMAHNAAWLSEKLVEGAFLNRVMDEVEEKIR